MGKSISFGDVRVKIDGKKFKEENDVENLKNAFFIRLNLNTLKEPIEKKAVQFCYGISPEERIKFLKKEIEEFSGNSTYLFIDTILRIVDHKYKEVLEDNIKLWSDLDKNKKRSFLMKELKEFIKTNSITEFIKEEEVLDIFREVEKRQIIERIIDK